MEEPKVILIVEDDNAVGKSIEHGLHHFIGTEQGISLRTLRASEPIEAIKHIEDNDVALVLLDVNLANNTNGIDFATKLRKTHPYLRIIILTVKGGNDYKVGVYEQIRCADFFTKPIDWERLSSAVIFHLNAPTTPKERFLPVIDTSKDLSRIPRKMFLFLRGIKGKKKVDVFTVGESPQKPCAETSSISKHGTYEKFFEYMIPPEEKDLLQCEAVTIVNATKIIKVCKVEHYLRLEGYSEKIPIDPKFRPKIYAMFTD